MKNEIRTEIERPLEHRRPGVIANTERASVVEQFGDGGNIDNFQEGIGWRFQPGQFRIFAKRFFYGE